MKRVKDALAWEESSHLQLTKVAKADCSSAPSPAPGGRVCSGSYTQEQPAGEGDFFHAKGLHGRQNEHDEEFWCVAREDDEENSSLLNHQDPRVRLRALTCLHGHIDLLSCDAAGIDRLAQALYSQLPREGNPHVAQQIVRLMSSLVIFTCKQMGQESDNEEHGLNSNSLPRKVIKQNSSMHERGSIVTGPCFNPICSSHSSAEEDIRFCSYCKQPALTKSLSIDKDALLPTSEIVSQIVKMLLSNGLAETESLTLKLQTLCSLYQIAADTRAASLISLCPHFPKLLDSSNPYVRAHTLHLAAMVTVSGPDTDYLPSKEDSMGLFEKYTHDSNALVRKTALQSFVLLYVNGYILTNGCYQAALSLLQDLNANVRTLALQVISLWVDQDPEQHTNHAFLQVCKMMTDMELCVRIEACKALLRMGKIREDVLLQALSKQPLQLSAKVEEPQSSSLITISESDVDISQYEQGFSILDQFNMGAFVHGIEDEFYEVRALSLNALARFCCGSARIHAAIIEVMINLVNDDSKHVRLKAVHALIHVAHQYGLQVNDNDLQTVLGTLEDIDGTIQDAGQTFLAGVQLSSVDSFKSTIESLMKYMQRSLQENVRHALYSLGRAHSKYVQVLAKDLVKEFKGCLSKEAGLDAPECGCILLLFLAASESNTKIVSLLPSYVLSLARLLWRSISEKYGMMKANSTESQTEVLERLEAISFASKRHLNTDMALSIDSDHRRKVHDFLACTARRSWNVKDLLLSGMINISRQVLSGCKRDLKRLLNGLDDEDQSAQATYVLHYVDCIDFVSQSWTYFQQKGRKAATTARPSLLDLARRLEFVVRCMQHTYIGHTSEQKLDLLELSTIPLLWRMTAQNVYGKPEAAVEFIKNTIGFGSSHTPFLQAIKEKLFEVGALSDSINIQEIVHELVLTFWPRHLTVNSVRMLKAALTIPGNDMEHPTQFVPNMPFGITVSVFTQNLDNSRVWVRMQVDSVRTEFVFLDAEDYKGVNPFFADLQIHGVSNVSKCIIKAAVVLECPGTAHTRADRGPNAYVLPLTSDKMIYLQSSSNTHC